MWNPNDYLVLTHLFIPLDVPRIPCVTCGKLVNRDYMKEHAFIHTKERPFLFEQCGSTFSLADRLRVK